MQPESTAAQMHEIPVALAHAYRDLEVAARNYLAPLPYRDVLAAAKERGDVLRAALDKLNEVRSV